MQPAARLATTIAALAEILGGRKPADVVLAKFFRARRFIGAKDRGAIAARVYNILRHMAKLRWWVQRAGAVENPRALALADILLFEQLSAAAVAGLCSGEKYAPAALNDREQKLIQLLAGQQPEHAEMPDDVRFECPAWLQGELQAAYGKDLPKLLQALQEPATVDLRVNTLKTTRDKILPELVAAGLDASAAPYSPLGIRLAGRPNLNAHPALKQGLVEIQDEGSQLIAALVDAKPGMRVLDLCAGAGGKTLAIAAAMQNKGKIVACDVEAPRLGRSMLRLRRAGVHNVEAQVIESEHDKWLKRHKAEFDRVLVDAPCSGTGTWRRNPDARWRHLGPSLAELVAMQQSILQSAARLVKPGGWLIYATCSILPSENQNQVSEFLQRHDKFKLLPVTELWPRLLAGQPCPVNAEMMALNPATHGTDGFFCAVMELTAS